MHAHSLSICAHCYAKLPTGSVCLTRSEPTRWLRCFYMADNTWTVHINFPSVNTKRAPQEGGVRERRRRSGIGKVGWEEHAAAWCLLSARCRRCGEPSI